MYSQANPLIGCIKTLGVDFMNYGVKKFARLLLKYRSQLAVIMAVAVFLGVPALVNSPAMVGAAATMRELPIYSVARDNKCVSFTFDAAWGNEDTQLLIDILERYNIKATFFLVGEWVDKYPESVLALHEADHEIMSHSDDHAHFNKLSEGQIIENLGVCNDKIESIIGLRPTLFRPPYGEYDDHVIRTVRSIGMEPIQWDVDSLDWKGISAEDITKRVTSKVQPGSIVLFHNAAEHTPKALPGIIEYLLSEGYQIIPASEILIQGDYTIDHTGKQWPATRKEG